VRYCYIVLSLALACCSSGGHVARRALEAPSPAVHQGRLTEAVGFETLGGVFTKVLMPCTLPCETTEVFSTAADNQPEIALHVFRGSSQFTADAHPLGRFAIRGLPPRPRGVPQIDVTIRASVNGLALLVRDRDGARLRIEPLEQ
jgi:molecular chaperone DnaK (HSP70)